MGSRPQGGRKVRVDTSNNMESRKEVYKGNNVKHTLTFGAQQAGGINLRRGRNNLRPLSADVSLLTSEGRKIGKQDKSIEKEESQTQLVQLLKLRNFSGD